MPASLLVTSLLFFLLSATAAHAQLDDDEEIEPDPYKQHYLNLSIIRLSADLEFSSTWSNISGTSFAKLEAAQNLYAAAIKYGYFLSSNLSVEAVVGQGVSERDSRDFLPEATGGRALQVGTYVDLYAAFYIKYNYWLVPHTGFFFSLGAAYVEISTDLRVSDSQGVEFQERVDDHFGGAYSLGMVNKISENQRLILEYLDPPDMDLSSESKYLLNAVSLQYQYVF